MNKRLFALVIATVLLSSQVLFVSAQLGSVAPPPTDAVSTSSPQAAPVEEIITPPADTTGPTFTSIQAVSVLPTDLTIAWTMDELATSYVEYGTSSNYGSKTPESGASSLEGTAVITNLTAGTTYHYRVVAKDAAGNISYSADHTAQTEAEPVIEDNEPPTIFEIGVTAFATSTATIAALTGEPSLVKVEYGTNANYGSVADSGEEFSLTHAVSLRGLSANTLYHYRVEAVDEAGNITTSFDNTFTTEELVAVSEPTTTILTSSTTPTTQTPTSSTTSSLQIATTTVTASTSSPQAASTTPFAIIEPLVASISTSSVKIQWATTELSTGELLYGTTPEYGSRATSASSSITHSVTLAGLSPETSYRYGIHAVTPDGRTATVDDLEFTTLPQIHVVAAPHISNVQVTKIATSTATILWTTNVPTEGDLHYGTSTAYGFSADKHSTLLVEHSHGLTGLMPDTAYHYQALVSDPTGNTSISEDRSFRTAALAGNSGTSLEEKPSTVLLPDPPDTTPPPPTVLSGGAKPPTPLPKAGLIKADALDGQVVFVFDKTVHDEHIRVVRRNWVSPRNAWHGQTVYEGKAESFTDIGLVNDHTYHYGIYHVDQFRGASKPILLTATPTASKDEVELIAVPPSVSKTPHFVFGADFSIGSSGHDVEHLQMLLKTDPTIYPAGVVSGYFGPLTKAALIRFQKKHNLPATAVVDRATRKELEAFSMLRYLPEATASFSRDLSLGMSGDDVLRLQKWLSEAGNYPEGIFSGYFGPLTKQAVINFQRDMGIVPALGYVGPVTRHAMEHSAENGPSTSLKINE